jgi:hypothetical protein
MCIDRGWITDSDNVDELLYNTTMVLVVKNMLLENRLRSVRNSIGDIKTMNDDELKVNSEKIIKIHEEFTQKREKMELDKIEKHKQPKKKIYEWVERRQPIKKSVGCQTSRYNLSSSASENNLLVKKTNLPKVAKKRIDIIRLKLNNRYEPLQKMGIDQMDFDSFDDFEPKAQESKKYKFTPVKKKIKKKEKTIKEILQMEREESDFFEKQHTEETRPLNNRLEMYPVTKEGLSNKKRVVFETKEFKLIDDEEFKMYFIDDDDFITRINSCTMSLTREVFNNISKKEILEVKNYRGITVYKLKYDIYMAKDDDIYVAEKIINGVDHLNTLKILLDVTPNI